MGEFIRSMDDFGITTEFEIVAGNGFNVKRTQDVESIIDENKRRQNDGTNGWTQSKDMKHVATIPLIIVEQWAKEAGIPKRDIYGHAMTEIIRKKLNDPSNLFLRTGLGEV
jgi:hypothetical protein